MCKFGVIRKLFVLLVCTVAIQSQSVAQNNMRTGAGHNISDFRFQSNNTPVKVNLSEKNTTKIEICRDGNQNTSTGYAFRIDIDKKCVTRHAGNEDNGVGVVDTYYNDDKLIFGKALSLINSFNLYKVAERKPLKPCNGVTSIKIFKNGRQWLQLTDSPKRCNVKGDFQKLVDRLVSLVGGEPEICPLVPDTELDYMDDDLYMP